MEIDQGRTIGPYEIIEQVGAGGMATVYKAWQRSMHRIVAIKVLPRLLGLDAVFVARFDREARTIASLEHARILPVYDYGNEGGVFYIVMRYLDSGTLAERIEAGPIPLAEVSRIISQIAEGLDYAHRRGVVHRDIKPSNIMLDDSEDIYITDFGLAKPINGDNQITGSTVVGSPAYMSPEQGEGKELDARSDIYSLGIVLYEMVVGETPFDATTPMALVMMHVNEPPPPPTSINPDIPTAVEDIIFKAIAKDPAERFQTAKEMAQALSRVVSQQVVDVIPPGGLKPAARVSSVRTGSAGGSATMKVDADGAADQTIDAEERARKFPVLPVMLGGLALVAVTVLISALLAVNNLVGSAGIVPQGLVSENAIQFGSEATLPENPIFLETFDSRETLSPFWRLADDTIARPQFVDSRLQVTVPAGSTDPWAALVSAENLLSQAGLALSDTYYVRTDVTFEPTSSGGAAGLAVVSLQQEPMFSLTRQYCEPGEFEGCSGDDIIFDDLRIANSRLAAFSERQSRFPAQAADLEQATVALTLVFRSGAVDAYYSTDQGNTWTTVASTRMIVDLNVAGVGVAVSASDASTEATFDNFVVDSGLPEFTGTTN